MDEEDVKFNFGPGKIVFRPIISHDETMTIYGKEQEFGEVEEIKPHDILSPEEQELQDTMDKITTEISSQLGIPKWKAESAVKAVIKEFGGK